MKDKKILVVMGGTSSEREISLKSGEAMLDALINKGYKAEKFVLNADNATDIINKKPDCVVLALHGKGGEDGTIQGMLELADIPYTGAGVASSAMCMDKIFTKKALEYGGVITAKFISVLPHEEFDAEKFAAKALMQLGLPVVLKAPCEGSSVGIEIVKDAERLPQACREIYEYEHQLLAEEYLPGIEMTVPVMKLPKMAAAAGAANTVADNSTAANVTTASAAANTEADTSAAANVTMASAATKFIGDDEIKTLPIIEIVPENDFYDFESKYAAGGSEHIIPARIPDYVAEQIRDLAIETYKVMNCDGMVRVDFMLGKYGRPHVVEINTLPGMTATSLVPDSAKAVGISFEDLVEIILLDAFNRIKHTKADVRK